MVLELGRYGSRDIMDVSVLKYNSGKLDGDLVWFCDFANAATNEWSSDSVVARGGKGAPRRISWQSAKEGKLTFTTQIFSLQQIASLVGRDVVTATTDIFRRELKIVEENASKFEVTLDKTPIDVNGDGTVDATDLIAYKYVNGVEAEKLTISTVTGSKVELTGVAKGDEVAVFYQWTTSSAAHKLTITADDFPQYVTIVGDTLFADEVAGVMVDMQNIYYKAKANPNFSFNYSNTGDPTELSIEFDLFAVKVNGKDTLADMIAYED